MNNKEIAERIVERMLESINANGYMPWSKPWGKASTRVTRIEDGYTEIVMTPRFWSRSGRPYSGINVQLLSMTGKEGEYITFAQAKKEGGRIRKGAKSSTIVFWNRKVIETEELDSNGDKIKKVIPLLKYYNVFSIEDVEGLEPKHKPAPVVIRIPKYRYETSENNPATIPEAEAVVAGYLHRAKTLTIKDDSYSDRAYYSPALDAVVVPEITQFEHVEEYYSTKFHELGHSTGHESRLNRPFGTSFGNEAYSREELVAEITSASILNILGLETGNSFRNSAAYIQSWSKHIKDDPMMYITASSRAEKAINLILGIEDVESKEEEDAA